MAFFICFAENILWAVGPSWGAGLLGLEQLGQLVGKVDQLVVVRELGQLAGHASQLTVVQELAGQLLWEATWQLPRAGWGRAGRLWGGDWGGFVAW